jgi:sterol desaturase/sphingolipid hydroxylase (fatty acid hydroxylase superfamily)
MQLTKLGYYSDFVVYPLAIVTLTAVDGVLATGGAAEWLAACCAGFFIWTLLEYALHRVALHWMAYFSPMHALHHGAPLALIGTPSWISISVWCGVILLPLWYAAGLNVADGITVGVMLGYWWYGIVHHVIHHHAHRRAPARFYTAYFDELRAWHMRHHHSPRAGNFGVTTRFWDYIFGTVIRSRTRAVSSA